MFVSCKHLQKRTQTTPNLLGKKKGVWVERKPSCRTCTRKGVLKKRGVEEKDYTKKTGHGLGERSNLYLLNELTKFSPQNKLRLQGCGASKNTHKTKLPDEIIWPNEIIWPLFHFYVILYWLQFFQSRFFSHDFEIWPNFFLPGLNRLFGYRNMKDIDKLDLVQFVHDMKR